MAVGSLAVRGLCVRKKRIEQENNSTCLGPVTSFSVCKMHEESPPCGRARGFATGNFLIK